MYLIFVVLAVVALGALFVSGGISGPAPRAPGEAGTTAELAGTTSGTLVVHDQQAGMVVALESVTTTPTGMWAAVREVLEGSPGEERLGNTLGAAKVGGPLGALDIPLLRATEAGGRYAVELYRDDAGGEFDLTKNSIYVELDTGAPAVAYFTATP